MFFTSPPPRPPSINSHWYDYMKRFNRSLSVFACAVSNWRVHIYRLFVTCQWCFRVGTPPHSPGPVNQVSSCSTVLLFAKSVCSNSPTVWAGKCSFPSLWLVSFNCFFKVFATIRCFLFFLSILVWLRASKVISITWCPSSASGTFCPKVCRRHLHSDWFNNRLTDWQGSCWYM